MTRPEFPVWLHTLAAASLAIALICAVAIAIDVACRPQKMGIMNLVWPLTALFGSVLWFAAYFAWGRALAPNEKREDLPFAVMVGKGASHCGAGARSAI